MSTPEERVRQNLLKKMVEELGFPKGLLSVEKKIGERRYDIVAFTRSGAPLLLVECKAVNLKPAENQALGYNASLKAPFICLASLNETKTFWQEVGRVAFVPYLPRYDQLYEIFQRN